MPRTPRHEARIAVLTRNIIDIRPVGLLPGDSLGFHFNTRYQGINTLLAETQKPTLNLGFKVVFSEVILAFIDGAAVCLFFLQFT